MALFIRSFSRKLIPDSLHEISERVYVFNCCLSRTEMSESDYKSYMDASVSSLQKHHPGASYMVFNFSKEHNNTNSRSILSNILSQHEMTVVDYPLPYEGYYPLLPLEMIHYFLRSSKSWLSLEGQRNIILLHCEQGGWPILAFMIAALLLYSSKCSDEEKTLEMVYNQASKEVLLTQLSSVNPSSSQLRYLKYIVNSPHSDSQVMIKSLVLRNVPLLDGGKGCRLVVMIYGQDPSMENSRIPQLLFSSLSIGEDFSCYNEEECLLVKLDINRHVQGDVCVECIHLGEDLVTKETGFRVMFHTAFVHSEVLMLGLSEVDVLWDAKSKFPKDFKVEVHFSAEISSEVATEQEEIYYESESEFFEVEQFDIFDSDEAYYRRKRTLAPNYTIEDLGDDDDESESGICTQSREIMFSVESFKELCLDHDDDEEDEEGDSDASSVENIVIIDKTEKSGVEADGGATANSKHVLVFAVSQEQDTELASDIDEVQLNAKNSQISYEYEANHACEKPVDSESYGAVARNKI